MKHVKILRLLAALILVTLLSGAAVFPAFAEEADDPGAWPALNEEGFLDDPEEPAVFF